MSASRPNLIIAATVADAVAVKREFRELGTWHVMTPRSAGEHGWLYDTYTWTPAAQELAAQVRWDLRQRLRPAIDEESEEMDFPTRLLSM